MNIQLNILSAALSLILVSCDSQSNSEGDSSSAADTVAISEVPADDPTVYTTPENTKANNLIVYDEFGEQVTLVPESNTIYCSYATWCPYSKQLSKCLKDPDIIRLIGDIKFVFLLERNEWPTLRRMTQRDLDDHQISTLEAQERFDFISEREQTSAFYDEGIIKQLKGGIYFFDSTSNLGITAFPMMKNGYDNDFGTNTISWLRDSKGAPNDLIEKYSPK